MHFSVNAHLGALDEAMQARAVESWSPGDWRHRLQLGVAPDWRLPVEEYHCPSCGSLHSKGWACVPHAREIPHVEVEGC
jgi:hypothetical protein